MTPFSDEDLKRLKEDIAQNPKFDWFQLPALLARLEAGEPLAQAIVDKAEVEECDYCVSHEDDNGKTVHAPDCQLKAEIEAWRKASGK